VVDTNIIVDASVLAKWFLPDELARQALKIRDDFAKGDVSISLPALVFYEMSNLLKSAVASFRIDQNKALKVYSDFLELDFEIYFTKELAKSALEKSVQLDISSYDASYLVLAEYLQISLYTADYKLKQKAKSHLVKNLTDYQISN